MSDLQFADYSLVSFDIFDTLLHRMVLAPVDVFELVRLCAFEDPRSLMNARHLENFREARVRAEADARLRRIEEHGGEGEVSLDEIYEYWQREAAADRALADWLKGLELKCEAATLYASTEGKALYDAARAAGCNIILVSDMYLPSDFLRGILMAEGFDGAAECPIYVSGEVRLSKHMGTIYGHIAEALGRTMDSQWVHVGDSPHADVTMAREAGLETFHANWARVRNVPTVRPGAHGSGNLVQSLVQAMTEPHAQSRLPEDPLERIGYRIWGPMLFGFTCWLIAQFRSDQIEHAVFVARDGWLMRELVRRCLERLGDEQTTSQYFHMSRQTGFKTGVRDWHPARTIFYAVGKMRTTARQVFASAGLDAEIYRHSLRRRGVPDIDAALSEALNAKVVQALDGAFMDVLRRNAREREALAAYYDAAVEGMSRVALVDIGWVGNIQRCFLHSLSDPIAKGRVYGYYLGLHRDHMHPNAELGMTMHGWLNGSDNYEYLNRALLSGGVELLEFILTAPHGSTIDLVAEEKRIAPMLEQQAEQEKEHQAMAARAQAGVLRFVEDHLFLLDWLSPATLSNTAWADAYLSLVLTPDDEALEQLTDITHSDGPGSNEARLVLAPKLPSEDANDLPKWETAREIAFWKAAFDRRNPRPST